MYKVQPLASVSLERKWNLIRRGCYELYFTLNKFATLINSAGMGTYGGKIFSPLLWYANEVQRVSSWTRIPLCYGALMSSFSYRPSPSISICFVKFKGNHWEGGILFVCLKTWLESRYSVRTPAKPLFVSNYPPVCQSVIGVAGQDALTTPNLILGVGGQCIMLKVFWNLFRI